MLKFFRRDQIDIDKWDDCIKLSRQSIIYALSWYLDIVSPHWVAFIKEEEGKYSAVFPLSLNRKFTINYIFQPYFTQQLGLFSLKSNNDKADLDELLSTLLVERFNYIDYNYNTTNTSDLKVTGKILLKEKLTHHLDLNGDYQTLLKAFSENHKRNIKKGLSQNLQIKYSTNIARLIALFREKTGKNLKNLKEANYEILTRLYKEAASRNMCKLIFAEDINGVLQAGGLFFFFNNNITYIFGASGTEGKQHGGMSLIFNEVIKENSGTAKILDFEGSDIKSIARFYRGFGGQAVPYVSLKYNNLPLFLKIFKK